MGRKFSKAARDDLVGVVGLGIVGLSMVKALLASGRPVIVFDENRARIEPMLALGAQAAKSLSDLARNAGLLICLVDDGEAAREAILGTDGFAASARRGDIVILMSTVDWAIVQVINEMLSERGIAFVDAPVTGLRTIGSSGTASLKCFAGGMDTDFNRVRPVLEIVTSEIFHVGKAGHGTAFKIIHSMIAQTNRVVAAEALALGTKAGLDPRKMWQILSGSSADSAAMQQLAARVVDRNFEGIPLTVTIVDVELQILLGQALCVPLLMTNQARNIYRSAQAMGFAQEDGSSVIKVYEAWSGAQVDGGAPVAMDVCSGE